MLTPRKRYLLLVMVAVMLIFGSVSIKDANAVNDYNLWAAFYYLGSQDYFGNVWQYGMSGFYLLSWGDDYGLDYLYSCYISLNTYEQYLYAAYQYAYAASYYDTNPTGQYYDREAARYGWLAYTNAINAASNMYYTWYFSLYYIDDFGYAPAAIKAAYDANYYAAYADYYVAVARLYES